MSLRSAHLPGDWDHVYGDPAEPHVCSLCGDEVYSFADEFATQLGWTRMEMNIGGGIYMPDDA